MNTCHLFPEAFVISNVDDDDDDDGDAFYNGHFGSSIQNSVTIGRDKVNLSP
jgi:hypothetical protein